MRSWGRRTRLFKADSLAMEGFWDKRMSREAGVGSTGGSRFVAVSVLAH